MVRKPPPIAVPNQSGDWLKSTAIKSLEVATYEGVYTVHPETSGPGSQHPTALWRRMIAISVKEMDTLMPEA